MVTGHVKRNVAPGELELVRAFINTADLERGLDELEAAQDLRRWLLARDLLAAGAPVSSDDHAAAIVVREALRDLAGGNAGRPPPRRAAETLDVLSQVSGLRPRFEPAGTVALAPAAAGVTGALGRMLGIVVAAVGSGGWDRLKTCRNPGCRWAFYDNTRNRSGAWCDMSACGSRAKSRAYHARQRDRAGPAGGSARL